MPNTRVLIIEPPSLSQQIQRANQTSDAGLEILGTVAEPAEALDLLHNQQIEMLVVDLPETTPESLQTLRTIRAQAPRVIVLVRTDNAEDGFILRAIKAGAMGFIGTDSNQAEILAALRTVRSGKAYLPPNVTGQFVRDVQRAYRRQ